MVYFESEVPPAPGVFAGRSDLADGVALQTLDPGTILTLQTHNSTGSASVSNWRFGSIPRA